MTINTQFYSYTPVVDQLQRATHITNVTSGVTASLTPSDKLLYSTMYHRFTFFMDSPEFAGRARSYHDNQDQLADAIGADTKTVSRGIRKLKDLGLVLVSGKKGRSHAWEVVALSPDVFLLEKQMKDGTRVNALDFNPFADLQKEERPALETSPPQRIQEPAQTTKHLSDKKILTVLPVPVKQEEKESLESFENYPDASRIVLEDLRASNDNPQELYAKVNSYVQDYTQRHLIRPDEEDALLTLIDKGLIAPDATKVINEIHTRRFSSEPSNTIH